MRGSGSEPDRSAVVAQIRSSTLSLQLTNKDAQRQRRTFVAKKAPTLQRTPMSIRRATGSRVWCCFLPADDCEAEPVIDDVFARDVGALQLLRVPPGLHLAHVVQLCSSHNNTEQDKYWSKIREGKKNVPV